METTKEKLLGVLDRALAPTPKEQLTKDGRELLGRLRARYGDGIAAGYSPRILYSRTVQAEAKALLDGAAAKPTPAKAAEVPPLLPPKPAPAPAMSTAQLKAVDYDTVRFELPHDFAELDEPDRRTALLRAVWRCHAEDAVPALADEINTVTKGTKRFPASVGAAAAAFRREAIAKRIKKLNAHK